jgi:hypothetical protein
VSDTAEAETLTTELPAGRRWQATVDTEGNPRWRAGRELHASTTCIVRIDRSEPPTRLSEENQSSHHASPSDLTPSEASDTPTLRLSITGRSSPIVSPQRTASIQRSNDRSQATERPPRRPRFRVSSPRGTLNDCPRPEGQTEVRVERTRRATSCGPADKHYQPRATLNPARRQTIEVSQQETKTPSRGSLPFSGIRCTDRCALDCLPSAIRSQGFSPSQRFDPGAPSWLCFKPHPPIGLMGLQSFSRRSQP